MKIIRLFGIQLSGSRDECDMCVRVKRHRFRSKSISLRSNAGKCFCLYKKYYLFNIPLIHTKETYPDLEKAEDAFLESHNERLMNITGRWS